jgi:hypothetical protein
MLRSLRLGAALLVAGGCLIVPASATAATVVTMTGETPNASPFVSTSRTRTVNVA